MFNARDLLGQVMQVAMTDTTASRMRHAMGPDALGRADNPLAAIFGQMMPQGAGPGAGGGGLAGMAGGLLGDAGRSLQRGNPLAVGGLGALAGALLGGGGGAAKGALGGGVMALLGSIALAALRDQSSGPAPAVEEVAQQAPLGLREPQDPAEEAVLESHAALILRAMITAAKADGQIDGGEMERILGRLEAGGADDAARAFVLEEMRAPQDLDRLVRAVDRPELAVEVYAASLLALEVDTPAERDYLRRLAERLNLDPATVRRVHGALAAPASG